MANDSKEEFSDQEFMLDGQVAALKLALHHALQVHPVKVLDEIASKLDESLLAAKRDRMNESFLDGVADIRDRFQRLASLI